MTIKLEEHITVDRTELTPVDILSSHTSLSKQKIKAAMQKGCVWLTRGKSTRRLRRAKSQLSVNDELHIYYDEHVLNSEPPTPTLIADEKEFSVWNKPCGMLSQGSKWGDHCSITRWAEQHLKPQRNAFTVHRLDRAANGLILIAHSKAMAGKLSALFQSRDISKIYRAHVEGQWTYEETMTIDEPIDGKAALSLVTLIQYDNESNRSLLEVKIETGRKHQIRKHLSHLGFPIIGDRLYDSNVTNEDLQLTAFQLAFMHPNGKKRLVYQL